MALQIPKWVPKGFSFIRGGEFKGERIPDFAIQRHPVTNEQWGGWVRGLGEDRFALLHHDSKTGATRVSARGRDPWTLVGPHRELSEDLEEVERDLLLGRNVLISGPLVLFKLVDDPSAQYNEEARWAKPGRVFTKGTPERIFNRPRQPVVGVHWFGAWLYCHDHGAVLPPDLWFEYGASNGDKQEFCSDVWIWMAHNPRKEHPYGQYHTEGFGREATRYIGYPDQGYTHTGFVPVVLEDSGG